MSGERTSQEGEPATQFAERSGGDDQKPELAEEHVTWLRELPLPRFRSTGVSARQFGSNNDWDPSPVSIPIRNLISARIGTRVAQQLQACNLPRCGSPSWSATLEGLRSYWRREQAG